VSLPWFALIPAYCPSDNLVDVVRDLLCGGASRVVVVNDGSPPDFDLLFDRLRSIAGVDYLTHSANRGKGAALKTGLHFILETYPDCLGVVTADADGQHTAADIGKIAQSLSQYPQQLILGSRDFSGALPWRSWFGNTLTQWVFAQRTGQRITDTQTGLRGIPANFLPELVNLPRDGYEYEISMLLTAQRAGVQFREVPITTVYAPGNPSSHFHPITDSFKVYRELLRPAHWSKSSRLVKLSPSYLKSIATISDRMPKLYYHPIQIARDFFWLRLAVLAQLAQQYVAHKTSCLDFACGSGVFLPTLSAMFREVTGIDLEMTEARQIVAHYQLFDVKLVEADINLAQLDQQFDAIFAADVLEHFDDLQPPVAKISQWLKPDGVLLTSLPTENIFTRLTRLVGGHQKPWDHYHTGREVEQFLANHGFRRIVHRTVMSIFPLYYLGVWRKQ